MKLLKFKHLILQHDSFKSIWGVLYTELNTSKLAVQFYVIFFLNRLILAVSFMFLKEYPLIQVITCSLSCMMKFMYVLIVRPFGNRLHNYLNIIGELNITLGYSLNLFFIIDCGIESKVVAFIILSCIITTYAIHNILAFYNITRSIITKFREKCSRSTRQANLAKTTMN